MTSPNATFVLGASSAGLGVIAAVIGSPVIGVTAAFVAALAWYFDHRAGNAKEATAKTRAEEAERALIELQKSVAPRRLTETQRNSLIERIRESKGRIAVVSPMLDSEASDFADDIDAALREAGWETARIRNWISSGFGVSVGWLDGPSESDLAFLKAFATLLSELGIMTGHRVFTSDNANSMSPGVQPGVAYLLVATKPLLVSATDE